MPLFDVDTASGSSGIKVNVPFVNVNVGGSQAGVKVRAPFVNVDTGQGVSVQAPFVNFGTPSLPQPHQQEQQNMPWSVPVPSPATSTVPQQAPEADSTPSQNGSR